ncbi:hypothetical protein LIN78_08475 [Leeia sp. TBRC 13508]|uniref:Uncharacterized protein n=1 Tax=Leeia speluncae TaxID=2884804 RepID=A0ABS8D6I0_9NEIS|nr:hypothetical protein [Leeia speluncae]MCB6183581.1 hypothetical protein [Leeia speluncae]
MLEALVSKLMSGGKVSTELKTLQGATTMLASYAAKDFNAAFATLVQALKQIDTQEQRSPKKRAQAFIYSEDTARKYYKHLMSQLIRMLDAQDLAANSYYHMVLGFQEALIECYRTLVFSQPDAEKKLGRDILGQLVCRSLLLLADKAFIQYLRYESPDDADWANANKFYAMAESAGFTHELMPLYGTTTDSKTCEGEFLRMQILALSQPQCFSPLQIAVLNDWLIKNMQFLSIDKEINPQAHSFAINLQTAEPAVMLTRKELGDGIRYLSTQSLIQRGGMVLKQLEQRTDLKSMGFPSSIAPELVEGIFSRTTKCWSRSQYPKRRDQRVTAPEIGLLYQGVTALMASLKFKEGGANEPIKAPSAAFDTRVHSRNGVTTVKVDESLLDERAPSSMWLVEDHSVYGLGLRQHNTVLQRPAINDMVAVRFQNKLRVCVVRRISMGQDDRQELGLEVLAVDPQLVMLRSSTGITLEAVFAVGIEGTVRTRALLLPPHFEPRPDPYLLVYKGKEYKVQIDPQPKKFSGGNIFSFVIPDSAGQKKT